MMYECSDIVLSCSSCIETTKILCGQLNARCTTCQVVHRALSCPQVIHKESSLSLYYDVIDLPDLFLSR